MKRTLIAAAAALALNLAAAQEPPRVVTWNCSGCHGLDGNANWPQVPRLAGQPAAYLGAQRRAYAAAPEVHVWAMPAWLVAPAPAAAGARNDPAGRTFMVGMAQSINPAEAAAAVAWYAARKPLPGAAADPTLADLGKALFERGLPAQGVVPCGDCHGAQAQGPGRLSAARRPARRLSGAPATRFCQRQPRPRHRHGRAGAPARRHSDQGGGGLFTGFAVGRRRGALDSGQTRRIHLPANSHPYMRAPPGAGRRFFRPLRCVVRQETAGASRLRQERETCPNKKPSLPSPPSGTSPAFC